MSTQNGFTQSLYKPDEFTVTYELVPGQGSGGRRVDRLLAFAERAREDGRIKALSITDNPGGHPALAPVAIGSDIRQQGMEPLIHFSLKDKNRNQVESHLFHYHRQRFTNLLVLGGDFPRPNYHGQAKPVFDLDSVQTLRLMRDMEEGTYQKFFNSHRPAFEPIAFNRGCVVSPFKVSQSEQVWQYAKLLKKIKAGAQFIITQLGYDICKFEELIRFMQENGVTAPVLGNVFVPSRAVAGYMLRGKVPGIVFPEILAQQMVDEAERGDREARLIRAAKMIGVLKGLGFSGVHLGGNGLDFKDVQYILDAAEEMAPHWDRFRRDIHFPIPGTWYLYPSTRPEACGKARNMLNPGRLHSRQAPHKILHDILFSLSSPAGRVFGRFCLLCGGTRKTTAILRTFEKWIKTMLFHCRMCGDCTLAELTYICPQSGCPKNLLNGPCGGSRNMTCEVFPDRYCYWVRVYNRVDRFATPERLGSTPFLPPRNWALDQNSSWINYFSGRDHCRLTMNRDAQNNAHAEAGNGNRP
jgi:methylenetetrahydrofolate reductase (NADPH)